MHDSQLPGTSEAGIEAQMGQVIEEAAREIRKNWGWLLFGGIALTLLGSIGLYMAGAMTIVSMLWFGGLVIAGGVFVLADGIQARGWSAKIWEILLGILYIGCGVIMILYPGASAVWFTLFIAAFLTVTGIVRIIIGFQLRGDIRGWGLTICGGVASLVLALLIYSEWPVSGLWVIGLFVSIEMLMQGVSMIAIGLEARAAHKVLD